LERGGENLTGENSISHSTAKEQFEKEQLIEEESGEVNVHDHGTEDIFMPGEEEWTPQFLQQKITEVILEKEELTNRLLRLQADFENYRRRVRTEKEELGQYAIFNFVEKMLPVIDNLERASASKQGNEEGIVEGIRMILKQLLDILESEGVTPIDCLGKPFDPNRHEAMLRDENSDYPADTIVEELQKGYLMYEKVLRPSLVKVAVEK
jgi:molecular chaperone GrpE